MVAQAQNTSSWGLRQEESKLRLKILISQCYTVRSCLKKNNQTNYFYFHFIYTITEQEVVVGQVIGGKYQLLMHTVIIQEEDRGKQQV